MPKKPWKTRALAAEAALRDRGYVVRIVQRKGPAGDQIAETVLHCERGLPRAVELDALEAVQTESGSNIKRTRTKLEIEVRSYYQRPIPHVVEESAGHFLRRVGTDGAKWALEFAGLFGGDPTPGGDLHGWFANAIEAGITEGESRERKRHNDLPHLKRTLEDLEDEYGRLSVVRQALRMWPDITEDGKLRLRPEPSRPLSVDVAAQAVPCDRDPIECNHEAAAGEWKERANAARTQLAQLAEAHEDMQRRHKDELELVLANNARLERERDEASRSLAASQNTLTGVLAENERLTRERDEIKREYAAMQTAGQKQVNNLVAENQRLRVQAHEHDQLLTLQHRRSMEATARWRAEDPAKREGVMPDLGDLLSWLMAEIDTTAAERDRAEAALSEYRGE